jgi:hypothetical protein
MLTGQDGNTPQPRLRIELMARIAALLVVIGATLAAGPVQAQSGNIFSDSPPRPPADVPNGPFPAQPPPVQYPGQYPSRQQYPPQQQSPPPQQYPAQRQYAPAQSPVARGPSSIQAQPLPPPPGASLAPASANRGNAPAPALPPGAATLPAPANPAAPQQSDTSQPASSPGQENDTTVVETPTEKIENGRAEFAGLDKITGRTIKFDSAIGETVQFGALQVTARACNTRPPTEPTNTDAFVEVDEVTLQGEIKRIFTGWMFASSPGLNAVEHPVYDVWLTGCEQPLTGPVAESTPFPPPPGTPGPADNSAPAPQAPVRQTLPPRRPANPPPPEPVPSTDD